MHMSFHVQLDENLSENELVSYEYLLFSFSEKATKIWSYLPLDLTLTQ